MLTIPEQSLFGLDISQAKLRLAQVRSRQHRKVITALRELSVPPGVIVDGQIADPKRLTQLIATIVHGRNHHERVLGNGVISVLPETKTFVKLITLASASPDEVAALLPEEITHHIPLPLEEIYYDWQFVGTPRTGHSHVLIGAAPRELVDTYLMVLREAGLLPFALEIEALAITRCLLGPEAPEEQLGAQVIIDFGAIRTGLIVVREGVVQFTVSLPISGTAITERIAETLSISREEAEQAKLVCGLDRERCQGALRRVLELSLDELAGKIEAAVAFYEENFDDHRPIRGIILAGGGANFRSIDQVLAERIKLPVAIANPLANVSLNHRAIGASALQSYLTAIGLALRGTWRESVV